MIHQGEDSKQGLREADANLFSFERTAGTRMNQSLSSGMSTLDRRDCVQPRRIAQRATCACTHSCTYKTVNLSWFLKKRIAGPRWDRVSRPVEPGLRSYVRWSTRRDGLHLVTRGETYQANDLRSRCAGYEVDP